MFDAGKITGGVLSFRPGAGESFRALNGKDYVVRPEDCAIADFAGVQSLAGVIGGEATGCDENTSSVFVECALFDPVRVALSGRHHGLTSDARQRFERGIDPALLPDAIEAATRMILDLCGGEPSEVTAAGAEPAWQRNATLRFARVRDLGGLDVAPDDAVESLVRLGFAVVSRDAASVTVAVPPWRNDVAADTALEPSPDLAPDVAAKAAAGRAEIEPECDLIEEVLRLRGLDAVPAVSLPVNFVVPPMTLTPRQTRRAIARRTLAARGMAECVTFSFMAQDKAALFAATPESARLLNPIASDLDQMRPTGIATLTLAAARNAARGYPDLALFEIGPAFPDEGAQIQVAAGLRCGRSPRHWSAAQTPAGALDAKADLWAVLAGLGVPMDALTVTADAPGFYHPGQSGTVRQGPKNILATFGTLHPRLAAAIDLTGPVAAFEVNLDAIQEPKKRKKATPDLPSLQPLTRDFAFLVDATVTADAVLRAARGAERTLIAGVSLFDRYEGDKVPDGKISLGIEVVLQPRDHTLTEAEIDAASSKIVAAVAKATGATLRG